ncbi:MAG: DUF4174 domain-containing protein [Planctomycetaceae bacterium]|nr:DUF4174 domain-containing protein [Planctomycetaceae bacterium]
MREGLRKIEKLTEEQSGKRHLFVFSPSRDDRLYQLQMDALSGSRCALDTYDIQIEEILESDSANADLRNELGIVPGQFKIVLLGRDSSIRLSAESCISCEEVIMRAQSDPELIEVSS